MGERRRVSTTKSGLERPDTDSLQNQRRLLACIVVHLYIKWKEIYETMEKITDRLEDVANVLQGVIVKMS